MDAHGGFYSPIPARRGIATGSRQRLLREDRWLADSRVIFPIHKPNGIGLSPDGKTLYVAETESARLWAWDLKGPGELAKPTTASPTSPHGSRLVYASPMYQRFDSLAVEANGNICIGTLDAASSPSWIPKRIPRSSSRSPATRTSPTSASAARTCAGLHHAVVRGAAGRDGMAAAGTAAQRRPARGRTFSGLKPRSFSSI